MPAKKYFGNTLLPAVDVADNPLDFMRPANVMFSEHPVSALARQEPQRAHEVMHRLLDLENRKVALEERKTGLAHQMAMFECMTGAHIEAIRSNPGRSSYTTKWSLGLFTRGKIKTTVR